MKQSIFRDMVIQSFPILGCEEYRDVGEIIIEIWDTLVKQSIFRDMVI